MFSGALEYLAPRSIEDGLVAYKATGAGAQVTEVISMETAIDPVCGMQVDVASANWVSTHDGTDYYFCAPGCKKAFDADPASFLT